MSKACSVDLRSRVIEGVGQGASRHEAAERFAVSAGAPHPQPATYRDKFLGKYAHRTIAGRIGHNLPQDAPQAFAQAVRDVTDL